MGRRAYSPKDRKRNAVALYFDDLQYRTICRVAREDGKPISIYLRSIILRECEKKEATQ